ncbi:MAG: hypothetical protein AAFQ82_01235 [Myxococcota bacterium]
MRMKRTFAVLLLLTGCTSFQASPPEGFAPFDDWWEFRAVSPEGVTFRVREEDNEPEADLAFWSEALKNRMDDAGYVFVKDGEVKAGSVSGYALELAAPFGQTDYSYLIAIFVQGSDIVIVESAGEVTEFSERRSAIDTAISNLAF